MKKTLLIPIGILLVLGLAFISCSDPTDFTNENISYKGFDTLDPPANVNAYLYEPTGYIRVSWDPVANASSYLVYRKSVASGGLTAVVSKTVPAGDFTFEDSVSLSNQFRAGASYTYKVVAVSNWSSTNQTGLGWLNNTGIEDWVALQNSSKDSNSVSFSKLPAMGSELPKVTNVKLLKGNTYAGSFPYAKTQNYILTWDRVPGVNYIVSYGPAGGLGDQYPILRNFVNGSGAYENSTSYISLPVIYGEWYVEVVATKKASVGGGLDYFMDSQPVSPDLSFVLAPEAYLAAPMGLGATTVIGNPNLIEVTWNSVVNADSYRVFRFIGREAVLASTTMVYDAWEEVTDSLNYYHIGGTQFRGYDAIDIGALPASSSIWYMIVALNANAVSAPGTVGVGNPYVVPAITAANLGLDSFTKEYRGIRVNWTPQIGEYYKVFRIPLNYVGATSETTEGTAVAVTFTGILIPGVQYGFTEQPEIRQGYIYRLEAYSDAACTVRTGVSYSGAITGEPYGNELGVSLYVDRSWVVQAPVNATDPRTPAYQIQYTITSDIAGLKKLMKDTESVRISRMHYDGNGWGNAAIGNDDYTVVNTIAKAALSDKPMYVTTGPGYFRFVVEIVDGSGALSALNTGVVDGNPVVFSNNAISASFPEVGTLTVDSSTSGTVKLSTIGANTARIYGTQLVIRIAKGATALEASDNFTNGIYEEKSATLLNSAADLDTYTASCTYAVTAGSFYTMQVYYKNGNYISGTPTAWGVRTNWN